MGAVYDSGGPGLWRCDAVVDGWVAFRNLTVELGIYLECDHRRLRNMKLVREAR